MKEKKESMEALQILSNGQANRCRFCKGIGTAGAGDGWTCVGMAGLPKRSAENSVFDRVCACIVG